MLKTYSHRLTAQFYSFIQVACRYFGATIYFGGWQPFSSFLAFSGIFNLSVCKTAKEAGITDITLLLWTPISGPAAASKRWGHYSLTALSHVTNQTVRKSSDIMFVNPTDKVNYVKQDTECTLTYYPWGNAVQLPYNNTSTNKREACQRRTPVATKWLASLPGCW